MNKSCVDKHVCMPHWFLDVNNIFLGHEPGKHVKDCKPGPLRRPKCQKSALKSID